MKQLLLELSAQQPPTFDTFVTGQNTELLQRLKDTAAAPAQAILEDRFVYLWGETGAGKTHLLQSLVHAAAERARLIIPPGSDAGCFDYDPAVQCYLLDDCEQLPPALQIAAFNLFNQIRELGGCLISAGAQPPVQLQVREDLRTRLGWGLIYQVHGLTDDEKIDALTQFAQSRSMPVPPGMLPYLLTHYRRDMPSLSRMLIALDRHSLETKRPITLPLLRDLLQLEAEEHTP